MSVFCRILAYLPSNKDKVKRSGLGIEPISIAALPLHWSWQCTCLLLETGARIAWYLHFTYTYVSPEATKTERDACKTRWNRTTYLVIPNKLESPSFLVTSFTFISATFYHHTTYFEVLVIKHIVHPTINYNRPLPVPQPALLFTSKINCASTWQLMYMRWT